MNVVVRFRADSRYGPATETFTGVQEVHFRYPSSDGERVAIEGFLVDANKTGCTYAIQDVAELEIVERRH